MASTGEVACIGRNELEAFFLSWLATEQTIRGKRIFVSIGGDEKQTFVPFLAALEAVGWDISATEGTQEALSRHGIGARCLYKASDEAEPNLVTAIAEKRLDLIINLPTHGKLEHETDGFIIRRLATDHHIPLITNAKVAEMFLKCLAMLDIKDIPAMSWGEFMKNV
jgi:methylglyoxal synthase